jgi:3-demethoxyubiquinol 3-hydroxylase
MLARLSRLRCGAPTLERSCRPLCASTPQAREGNRSSLPPPPPPPPRPPPPAHEARSPLLADAARKRVIDRMLRVDHAGELGARQIYAGQLAVFGGTPVGGVIANMAAQEQKHLDAFDRLVVERRVRPTAMLPVWNAAGYALGLGTALLGKEAAMACTVAVEEVIAEHYNDQLATLQEARWESEGELREMVREFRDDELEHKDIGFEHDAEKAPMYKALSSVIKAGCRGAIYVTERV